MFHPNYIQVNNFSYSEYDMAKDMNRLEQFKERVFEFKE
jgi:hypothetical protein